MEFLNSREREIVTRDTGEHRAQVSYILAIKKLTCFTEINTNTCAMIRSLFEDLMETIKESDVQVIELGKDGNAADSGRWRCGCERAAAMRPRAGGGAPPARSREQAAAMLLQQC